jgi:hypothetical protein
MPWFGSSVHVHTGTLGDLSEEQENILNDLREYIQDNNLDDPRFDDYYLLRFCRAKKFDFTKVITQFEAMVEWRREHDVQNCMVIYKCPNLLAMKEIYNHCWHKTDKTGRPMWMENTCIFNTDDLLNVISKEEMYQHWIRAYEELTHIVFPSCSRAKGRRIGETFSLVNLDGFSMNHMKAKQREVIEAGVKISDNFYPEILGQMVVINVPFIFRSAWLMIKPFVDSKTSAKIRFVGTNYIDVLLEYVDVDSLPEYFGGN